MEDGRQRAGAVARGLDAAPGALAAFLRALARRRGSGGRVSLHLHRLALAVGFAAGRGFAPWRQVRGPVDHLAGLTRLGLGALPGLPVAWRHVPGGALLAPFAGRATGALGRITARPGRLSGMPVAKAGSWPWRRDEGKLGAVVRPDKVVARSYAPRRPAASALELRGAMPEREGAAAPFGLVRARVSAERELAAHHTALGGGGLPVVAGRSGVEVQTAPESPARPGVVASRPQADFDRLLDDYFFRQSRLAPAGGAGFDPNLSPVWAGLKLPG